MKNFGILIVDDEETLHEILQKIFEVLFSEYSPRIFISNNGKEALEIVEQHSDIIKLVTTDINHPELDGIEMSRNIKQKYPEIKILIMSAFASDRVRKECEEIVDVYMHKPVNIDDLRTTAKDLLNNYYTPE